MKKATVYYQEINKRLNIREYHSKTIEIPAKMYDGWDWDGIVKVFKSGCPACFYGSTVIVKKIWVGNTCLHG